MEEEPFDGIAATVAVARSSPTVLSDLPPRVRPSAVAARFPSEPAPRVTEDWLLRGAGVESAREKRRTKLFRLRRLLVLCCSLAAYEGHIELKPF